MQALFGIDWLYLAGRWGGGRCLGVEGWGYGHCSGDYKKAELEYKSSNKIIIIINMW